ncbi:hypothetical protein QUF72_02475 [Desulfobacterales bacterium HSG2]|nr:hypothetical protein [Desulfobacterales bacterium HSG2]
MNANFAHVVEDVKQLSTEQKEELFFLVERYLIEERREEIYNDYEEAQTEFSENKLEFSSDINQLRELLS